MSVIVPVYNGMNYVGEAIASILGQTYTDLELLVVDDGSQDGLEQYVATIRDQRLRYLRQPTNRGAPAALNRGIREARGELVCWVSHDDVVLPEKVARQLAFMDEHREFGLSYTDNEIIDALGTTTQVYRSRGYPPAELAWRLLTEGNFINGSTVMIRRECFDRAGCFDETMLYVADAEMWFRLLRATAFGHLPEVLLKYRWHPGNQSHNVPAMRHYQARSLERLLELFPLQVLVPGLTAHASARERARAHALIARALEDTWREPRLAAREYERSLREAPSAGSLAGWLRTRLWLGPRIAVSNARHRILRRLQRARVRPR